MSGPLDAEILIRDGDTFVLKTPRGFYAAEVRRVICAQGNNKVLVNKVGRSTIYFYTGEEYVAGKLVPLTDPMKRRVVAKEL